MAARPSSKGSQKAPDSPCA